MELKRIVRGQGHIQTLHQVLGKRITRIGDEQRVVAQRRHGDADLGQVEQVLQDGHLAEQQPVTNALRREVAGDQMIDRAGFATVSSNGKCVQATHSEFFCLKIINMYFCVIL